MLGKSLCQNTMLQDRNPMSELARKVIVLELCQVGSAYTRSSKIYSSITSLATRYNRDNP